MAALLAWAANPANQGWVRPATLLDELGRGMGRTTGFDLTKGDLAKLGRFISELGRKAAGYVRVHRRRSAAGIEYRFEILS
jgi:hypothetical protein